MRTWSVMADPRFRVVYTDIGGVLGTNGWDSGIRHGVCKKFNLPAEEIDKRHRIMFDSYERGFMTLEDYLRWVFFASPRAFSMEELRDCIFNASVPWPQN